METHTIIDIDPNHFGQSIDYSVKLKPIFAVNKSVGINIIKENKNVYQKRIIKDFNALLCNNDFSRSFFKCSWKSPWVNVTKHALH